MWSVTGAWMSQSDKLIFLSDDVKLSNKQGRHSPKVTDKEVLTEDSDKMPRLYLGTETFYHDTTKLSTGDV